jgi:glycosyltransferase involved in cell wall biosynthesis
MPKKIAIVHDYLFQYGGAEKVVEKWLEMYPDADVYTSFYTPDKFKSSSIYQKATVENRIKTTWLQGLFQNKTALKFFKHMFWLYPIVMSFVIVKNYDVVLISSTYCAKNVRYQNCKKIIHYCHSPVRFLHGLVTETDHKSLKKIYRIIIPVFTFWLKWMDLRAVKYLNQQCCIWVGNSKFIQGLIKQVYNTDSILIYPPTEIDRFLSISRNPLLGVDEFYFSHGRISFHKRIDLAIKACLRMGRKLKISGQAGFQKEMDDLKQIVVDFEQQNPDKKGLIEFLGRTTDEQCNQLFSECKAFLFPGKEDAGIAPIEAFASGVPVIAYEAGGALEYLLDGTNGVFFSEQTLESLVNAIQRFEKMPNLDESVIKESSKPFSSEKFVAQIKTLVNS